MPRIKEISTSNDPSVMNKLTLGEQGMSCNGVGRLISLKASVPRQANVVIGEVNVRTGQRNLIAQAYPHGETVVGCSLLPNGEGISRQVNWAYGDTNYFPANVDDPYDSIVIVSNPVTGNRFVYNLHARNATIAILRRDGLYYQYLIGNSHMQGIALFPGETVEFAGWNAALENDTRGYPRRKAPVEIESDKIVAIADRLEIQTVGSEHVLFVRAPDPVNLIICTVEAESQHYSKFTMEPGRYVLGHTTDSAGRPVGRQIAWAYANTDYFPRDVWDGFEAVILVRDPVTKRRALWNLAPGTLARVKYFSQSELKDKDAVIEEGLFLPLQENDWITWIAMSAI